MHPLGHHVRPMHGTLLLLQLTGDVAMSDSKTPTCPICRKEVESLSENDYFPFCSKRCKLQDLGKWFDEDYSITMTPSTTERSLPDDDSTSN